MRERERERERDRLSTRKSEHEFGEGSFTCVYSGNLNLTLIDGNFGIMITLQVDPGDGWYVVVSGSVVLLW